MADASEGSLSPAHQKALRRAFHLLERQNFAAQLADHAGRPVDRLLRLMPKPASAGLNRAIEAAILRCLNVAIRSIEPTSRRRPARGLSSLLAGINAGVSGFFGFPALPIELPLTTTLMLRSIADIARHHGEVQMDQRNLNWSLLARARAASTHPSKRNCRSESIVCWTSAKLLNRRNALPKLSNRRAPLRARCGRWTKRPAPLVSMLLKWRMWL